MKPWTVLPRIDGLPCAKYAVDPRRIQIDEFSSVEGGIYPLHAWASQMQHETMPSGKLGEALGYLVTQWPKLFRYLEDPRVAIDTNLAENAIRPFALGRRNWLFTDTVKGAKASAMLYSTVPTARANGLEPYAYLRRLFAESPLAKTVEAFEALLPFNNLHD